jgi:hypothetical protein
MNRFTFSRRHQTGTKRPARARPVLELLEDRTVLSTLTVLNNFDIGAGSLRDTIKAAGSGDTILFDSSLSGQTITLSSGELTINKSLDIEGPGARLLAISGNKASRVFNVGAGVTATIAGLTVSNGQGAGISNAGTLTLSAATIRDNSGGAGSGLYNSGTATVTACTFTRNDADWSGSAVYNAALGTLTLSNSTVSGNTGASYGSIGSEGTTLITNCTIAWNAGSGGGIMAAWVGYVGTLQLRNTIVADNAFSDIQGDIVSLGHNLIGDPSEGSGFASSDLLNVDPLLAPLADNGGPTNTCALVSGSAAIDAGDNNRAPSSDQRGLPRIVNHKIDIGAYELQQASTASTTTKLSSSLNPSVYSQAVTFTATVTSRTGVPTGTVTFQEGSTVLDTETLSNGQAQFTTSALAAAPHAIAAVYHGDATFSGSAAALTQTVNRVGTTVTLSSSANPSNVGQSVTMTARVAAVLPGAGPPTGQVDFYDGTTRLGNAELDADRQATVTIPWIGIPDLSLGSHTITAIFSGWWNFDSSTSAPVIQVVNPETTASTTTVLTSSANPSAPGQLVTFTATVMAPSGGIPTGTVALCGPGFSGPVTLDANGQARFTVTELGACTYDVYAVYGGDARFSTSTATMTQVVQANTTTSLSAAPNPSSSGQLVTFTATVAAVNPVAGCPIGTVSFEDGSTILGAAELNGIGQAQFTTSALVAGSHTITAVYGGCAVDGGVYCWIGSTSSPLIQVVNPGIALSTTTALTSSVNPSVVGQAVTFTATVTVAPGGGTPMGTVTFKDGSTVLDAGTLDASGRATFATTSLSVGKHSITAVYEGNANYRASTSAKLTQKVNQANKETRPNASPNLSVYGQSVSLTPMDTAASPGAGTPTGAVTPRDGLTIAGRQHAPRKRQSGFHSPVVALGHLLDHHRLRKGIPIDKASTSAKLTWKVNA